MAIPYTHTTHNNTVLLYIYDCVSALLSTLWFFISVAVISQKYLAPYNLLN